VGTGGAPATEALAGGLNASSAFAAKAGPIATPIGAIMALRRKFRRVRVDFPAFMFNQAKYRSARRTISG
jgi:hypothetical protein